MLQAESTTITRDEEIQQLREQGFTPEQVDIILHYRDQYMNGTYRDEPPEYRRLDFLRWLYTNGKIEE